MRRTVLIVTLLLSGIASAMAQTTVKDIIKTIPQEFLPYIDEDRRKEINEFAGVQDTMEIKNSLNGTTRIFTANDNFAQIDLNEAARLQIKLLPVNDSTQIICLLKTVTKPVPDSKIGFYSTAWVPLSSDFNLSLSNNTDSLLAYFAADSMTVDEYEELKRNIEPVIISADIAKDENTITFSLSIPFVPKDDYDNIKAMIKQKTFKWDGKHFKIC